MTVLDNGSDIIDITTNGKVNFTSKSSNSDVYNVMEKKNGTLIKRRNDVKGNY